MYRGCDLRGNDLSSAHGVANLHGIVIDRAQTLSTACRCSAATRAVAASASPITVREAR
jgi:hypothetical protein